MDYQLQQFFYLYYNLSCLLGEQKTLEEHLLEVLLHKLFL